jgi:hypothetical protein
MLSFSSWISILRCWPAPPIIILQSRPIAGSRRRGSGWKALSSGKIVVAIGTPVLGESLSYGEIDVG